MNENSDAFSQMSVARLALLEMGPVTSTSTEGTLMENLLAADDSAPAILSSVLGVKENVPVPADEKSKISATVKQSEVNRWVDDSSNTNQSELQR